MYFDKDRGLWTPTPPKQQRRIGRTLRWPTLGETLTILLIVDKVANWLRWW